MYGTFTQKPSDQSIELLNTIYILPKEIWITIINYYCIDFTIACINKRFYDTFHIILLDNIDKLYFKFDTSGTYHCQKNIRRNFHVLYENTLLLSTYAKDKPPYLQNIIHAQISNHPYAHDILNNVEKLILKDEIDEQQFIYLSKKYHYDYETILAWRAKGCCCLTAYLPCFIVACPMCCPIWCPYIIYDTLIHCMDVDDTYVYKPLQPFSVLKLNNKRYYDPCDFSKYFKGYLCSFDEVRAFDDY